MAGGCLCCPAETDTGDFILGTFRDSIFVFPLQLSLLCFAEFFLVFFFSSLLFICLHLTFSLPCPSHLSPGLGCSEPAPTGGRQTPFPPGGVPALPRGGGGGRGGGAGRRPPACGRAEGGEPASGCHLLTRSFYCAAGGLFSVILGQKQEVADGTVILGGTEKVVACLGVLDQNPGGFCLFKGIGLESSRHLESFKCYQFLFYFALL